MTQFLPPNLLALFAPRDPIPFLPQLVRLPHEKQHNQPYSGIAPFIRHFEVNLWTSDEWRFLLQCLISHVLLSFCNQDPRDAPPPTRAETREERLERKVRRGCFHVGLACVCTCLLWALVIASLQCTYKNIVILVKPMCIFILWYKVLPHFLCVHKCGEGAINLNKKYINLLNLCHILSRMPEGHTPSKWRIAPQLLGPFACAWHLGTSDNAFQVSEILVLLLWLC